MDIRVVAVGLVDLALDNGSNVVYDVLPSYANSSD